MRPPDFHNESSTSIEHELDSLVEQSDLAAVNQILRDRSTGPLDESSMRHVPGRNHNFFGMTTTGAQIFVKKIADSGGNGTARFDRTIQFHQATAPGLPATLRTPRCLGWDASRQIIVYDRLENCRSVVDLADEGRFTGDLARTVGQLVRSIHMIDVGPTGDHIPEPTISSLFDAVPMWFFDQMSTGQIAATTTLQGDVALVAAMRALRERQDPALCVPSHNDLRLEQFLILDGMPQITDWEEFAPADPAVDIGAFAGAWLHRAVLAEVADRVYDPTRPVAPVPNILLTPTWSHQHGVGRTVEGFVRGYRSGADLPDPRAGLGVRTVLCAALHLFERMLGDLANSTVFAAPQMATYRVGRALALAPHRYVDVLGLGGLIDDPRGR